MDNKLAYLKSTPSGQDSYFIDTEDDAYNEEIEQLLGNKGDVPYYQCASSPDSNSSPLIASAVHTMEDYQPKNKSMARDTIIFRILEMFGDIVNKSKQIFGSRKYGLESGYRKNCFGKQESSRASSQE